MAVTKTTGWYTISGLGGFNSKNGYVGETDWYWGKYNGGVRSGFIGVGVVNNASRSAVLVFWVKFPSSLISSNITIDKIEVQMSQTVSSGISSGKNYATFACATNVQPDTPQAWNGTGRTNNPKIFASDNTVTTQTAGTTWYPTYTYTVTSRSNLPAGTEGCYIQFSGGNYQVQSMSEFTMGASTYPKFRFTYTDSSTTTYTITYYRNSTTSDTTTTSGGTVTSGTSYTLASCPWTRSGYSFNGWSTSRSASSGSAAGSTVAASTVNKNQVWYATWKSTVSSKTITFVDGSGYNSNGSKTAYSSSTSFRFPDESDLQWSRSGYTLKGWDTSSSGSTVVYSKDTSYSIAYSSLQSRYYAVWEADKVTRYITYYPGAYATVSNTSGNAKTQSYTEGSTVELYSNTTFTGETNYTYYTTNYYLQGGVVTAYNYPSTSSSYTRTGSSSNYCYSVQDDKKISYSYDYWRASDLTNGVRECGSKYNNLTGNITMWPDWESTVNYTAQFNPLTVSRDGYTFLGWATTSTGTPKYYSGTRYSQSSNQNLYAIWEANTYTIYYKPTVYCIESSSWADTSATPNTSYSLSTSYFTGVTWNAASQTYYTNYNCNTGAFSNGATSVSTSNSTYKQYRYKQTAWQTNNSLNSGTPISTYNNSSGASSITLYPYMGSNIDNGYQNDVVFTILEAPVKVGWAFKGWNTSSAGTGTMYQPGDKITQSKSTANFYNTQLYAIWEPEWTVKINNGTSWSDYHVWIYTGATSNNGWQQAIPYVYDGSKWKLTSI